MHTSLLFLWAVLVIIFEGSVAFRLSNALPTSTIAPTFKIKILNALSARVRPIVHASSRTSLSATLLSATNFDSISEDVTVVANNTRSMAGSTLSSNAHVKHDDKFSTSLTYGPHIKWQGAVLNMWGLGYALSLLLTSTLSLPLLFVLTAMSDLVGDTKRRRALDWLIHIWARLSLKLPNLFLFNSPTIYGLHHLPPSNEAVVYVPNHTTFFDILLLSGYIPRPFKYLSKIEISKIPIVGLSMKLARHVFLDRHNLNSAAECAETVHRRLLDGNSIALFAEGTRSSDGRLRPFKKGAFQMAKRANVKVVPVSIGHLHRIMPSEAVMPLASLRHTYIKIHPPIDTADKTVKEIQSACFEAVNAGLPEYQQYINTEAMSKDLKNDSSISRDS